MKNGSNEAEKVVARLRLSFKVPTITGRLSSKILLTGTTFRIRGNQPNQDRYFHRITASR